MVHTTPEPSVGATAGDPTSQGPKGPSSPAHSQAGRAELIADFLDNSLSERARGTCPFVILDDRAVVVPKGALGFEDQSPQQQALADRLAPNFVRTISTEGLSPANVAAAVAIFENRTSVAVPPSFLSAELSPEISRKVYQSFSSGAETDEFDDISFDVSSPPAKPNQYLLSPAVSIETAVSSNDLSMEALDGAQMVLTPPMGRGRVKGMEGGGEGSG